MSLQCPITQCAGKDTMKKNERKELITTFELGQTRYQEVHWYLVPKK